MKALKEKRIGVRSLLRRGLIILSLFALVFAVACGGDDGNSSTPTPDPDPGTTPPPAAKTVADIVVLTHPKNVSFQGAPPDLTGLVARVYFSDGTSELISDPTKFVGVPSFCDTVVKTTADTTVVSKVTGTPLVTPTAWNNPPGAIDVAHAIAYAGHTEKTAAVTLPWVVPLKQYPATPGTGTAGQYSLQLTGSAQKVLYSDQVPTFEGLVLEGFYEDYVDPTGKLIKNQKRAIPVSASYPTLIGLDDFNATTNPILHFGVGYTGSGNDKDDVESYDAYVSFNIEKIVQVSGVAVDMETSTFADYFDDDVKLHERPSSYDMLKDLTDNNTINLIVSYFDEEPRTITFAEYLANLAYYNSRQASGDTVRAIETSDGVIAQSDPRKNASVPILDILKTTEDAVSGLPYFNVVMNYVPSIWGINDRLGDAAWLHQFDIPLPVYAFSTAVATRKAGVGTSDVRVVAEDNATPIKLSDPKTWADTASDAATSDETRADHLMQSLVKMWELTGTYDRSGVTKEKKIPLTPQMFADGVQLSDATPANRNPLRVPGDVSAETFILDKTASAYRTDWGVDAAGLPTDASGRGYVLPIWYRGETINDAEMGAVTVTLVGP